MNTPRNDGLDELESEPIAEEISLLLHVENNMNKEQINETVTKALTDEEIDVFIPEPKHEKDLKKTAHLI